jgi:hypothetical protein
VFVPVLEGALATVLTWVQVRAHALAVVSVLRRALARAHARMLA